VRHLYVLLPFRRRGVGQRLIAEVVAAAHGAFDTLRLRTQNPEAARLYEALGFRRSDGTSECTHVMALAPEPDWRPE
jgi:ribosomal protein S18 acetylase RimI-like enzyme